MTGKPGSQAPIKVIRNRKCRDQYKTKKERRKQEKQGANSVQKWPQPPPHCPDDQMLSTPPSIPIIFTFTLMIPASSTPISHCHMPIQLDLSFSFTTEFSTTSSSSLPFLPFNFLPLINFSAPLLGH